jgi:imidazolonepropionase-like amidohydrolase
MRNLSTIFLTASLALTACSKAPTPGNEVNAAAVATTTEASTEAPTRTLPAQSSVLFRGVKVFDGSAAALTGEMNVLVEGGKITRIEATPIEATAGTVVIEGKGRTLMPGLIDNHVHLTMSAWSQADALADGMTAQKLEIKAASEAEAMLMRGFTAARDLGGPIFGLKAGIDKGQYIGPRVWPSGAMVSQTSGHGDARLPSERSRRFFNEVSKSENLGVNFIADGRDEVLTATRENLRFGASQIKVMAGGGAATAYDPLDVAQYTFDEIKAAVDAADDWNTYVTVHAYTVKAVRRAVDAGVKCIEHGQLLDEATMKLLAEKGVWLSLQALDEAPPSAPENVRLKKKQVVDGTDNAFKWAKKYGVKLAWGTDFLFLPAQNKKQSTDILKLKQWLSPAEILKLLTHDNAQLLALSGLRNPYPGKLGVIETGALADLLLVDGDPIANIDLLATPDKSFVVIMKDGRIFKDNTSAK